MSTHHSWTQFNSGSLLILEFSFNFYLIHNTLNKTFPGLLMGHQLSFKWNEGLTWHDLDLSLGTRYASEQLNKH